MPLTSLPMKYFDTLTNEMVEFAPREPGKVSIYACGPTVYDVPHLGHARTALTYDVIARFLRWRGFEVTMVANITDIDDKIIQRAAAEGTTETAIAETYTKAYIDQMDRLNIVHPEHRPHATEYVDEMQDVIQQLIDREHAYVIDGQGVYFSVASFEDGYGKLVHRSAEDLREGAGARVEVDERKKDPLDFALWKAAKPDEPTWPSPWGDGRPGWHIECVAMALDILGDGFDLHGGGTDLAFPHHENERSESEAAGHPFARGWIHSAMLNIGGEKMSKSLNNFKTLGDVLDMWDPRALRLAMLQTHYRKVMELGDEAMQGATAALDRLDAFQRRISVLNLDANAPLQADEVAAFTEAMDHDFGAPAAVATIFELVRAGHTAVDTGDLAEAASIAATISELSGVLGLVTTGGETGDDDSEIDDLVAQRQAARDNKDFAESDRLRDELNVRGIEVEDTAAGPIWRRVTPTNAN